MIEDTESNVQRPHDNLKNTHKFVTITSDSFFKKIDSYHQMKKMSILMFSSKCFREQKLTLSINTNTAET